MSGKITVAAFVDIVDEALFSIDSLDFLLDGNGGLADSVTDDNGITFVLNDGRRIRAEFKEVS